MDLFMTTEKDIQIIVCNSGLVTDKNCKERERERERRRRRRKKKLVLAGLEPGSNTGSPAP